jgi:fatty acid desaturase
VVGVSRGRDDRRSNRDGGVPMVALTLLALFGLAVGLATWGALALVLFVAGAAVAAMMR